MLTVLGLLFVILINLFLFFGFVFVIVRFVKWAWNDEEEINEEYDEEEINDEDKES